MSNWDFASEADLAAARDAYPLDDPKHPDYGGTRMELEVLDHEDQIVLFTGNPKERMTQMLETAKILVEPIKHRHTITINGREHVRVEGWTMLGALLGVHPYLVWSKPLRTSKPFPDEPEATNHWGWEARVEARTITGHVVGSAEAQCTIYEKNWRDRDDYALRSMAQTRATSKALRQPLGFVITLAGFDPTPAEEMPHEAGSPFKAPTKRARDASGEAEYITDYLSDNQRKKIYALRTKLTKAGVFTEAEFGEAVGKEYEAEISGLTRTQASHLIERLEKVERDLPDTH